MWAKPVIIRVWAGKLQLKALWVAAYVFQISVFSVDQWSGPDFSISAIFANFGISGNFLIRAHPR